jgi:hypothetical protein
MGFSKGEIQGVVRKQISPIVPGRSWVRSWGHRLQSGHRSSAGASGFKLNKSTLAHDMSWLVLYIDIPSPLIALLSGGLIVYRHPGAMSSARSLLVWRHHGAMSGARSHLVFVWRHLVVRLHLHCCSPTGKREFNSRCSELTRYTVTHWAHSVIRSNQIQCNSLFTRPAATGGSGLYLRNSVCLSVSLSLAKKYMIERPNKKVHFHRKRAKWPKQISLD